MEQKTIIENESQERHPDAAFTQEIDGKPYRIRVFFPENCAETLQEKIEYLLRMEAAKAFESAVAEGM